VPDLKPCPFCGAQPNQPCRSDERNGYNFSIIISCPKCEARIARGSHQGKAGWCDDKAEAEAVEAWNNQNLEPLMTHPINCACDNCNPEDTIFRLRAKVAELEVLVRDHQDIEKGPHMSSTVTHTDDGFVEFQLRLPTEVWSKIEPLAHAAGLTIDQMTQAIFTLQMSNNGWLKKEPAPDLKAKKSTKK